MAIKEGDRLPDATFMTYGPAGPRPITTDEVFKGKRVALLAVPGAFTPTCWCGWACSRTSACRRTSS